MRPFVGFRKTRYFGKKINGIIRFDISKGLQNTKYHAQTPHIRVNSYNPFLYANYALITM